MRIIIKPILCQISQLFEKHKEIVLESTIQFLILIRPRADSLPVLLSLFKFIMGE